MSLYQVDGSTTTYFDHNHDYLELWKLEVLLPGYQRKGYGEALVDFAKSFGLQFERIHASNLPVLG